MKNEYLQADVNEKYPASARLSDQQKETSCCDNSGCGGIENSNFNNSFEKQKGCNPVVDPGVGYGLLMEFAHIKPGDTVVDLGSGDGNDCFAARKLVGKTGKIIGIDISESMIEKARKTAQNIGFKNVVFRPGDIGQMPITTFEADVVISNSVLNLIPDKENVFDEIYRILKPGGHFSVSDVAITGSLPLEIKEAAGMLTGCVSGTIELKTYLQIIRASGFVNIEVQKKKAIHLPDEVLLKYLNNLQLEEFKSPDKGIFSVTVYGERPKQCCCCCNC